MSSATFTCVGEADLLFSPLFHFKQECNKGYAVGRDDKSIKFSLDTLYTLLRHIGIPEA